MAVRSEGRPARTRYKVGARFAEPVALSLVDVSLDTGRTHQIRVHLAAIGHPVAGDTRYGGTVRDLGLSRPFLHAARLVLTHPARGDGMVFEAPLAGGSASGPRSRDAALVLDTALSARSRRCHH